MVICILDVFDLIVDFLGIVVFSVILFWFSKKLYLVKF